MTRLNVLVACEFSGIVRDAFAARGHNAWSCDLLPSEKPGKHYQGDVRRILRKSWDLVIAHPPCTYLCNSGVRWLHTESGRFAKMRKAAAFVRLLLAACPRLALENPTPHRYAVEEIRRTYDQAIQPWQFGHGVTKRTCFWLNDLPLLKPTRIVAGRKPECHYESPGPDRSSRRSRTYQGIANAMAAQWG